MFVFEQGWLIKSKKIEFVIKMLVFEQSCLK